MSIAATRSHSPRFAAAAAAPDLALRIASVWLVLGCLAVLSLPALRGSSTWFGWLPFWLVLLPAVECLILRWQAVVALTRTTLAKLRSRRTARKSYLRRARRLSSTQRPRTHRQPGALLSGGQPAVRQLTA